MKKFRIIYTLIILLVFAGCNLAKPQPLLDTPGSLESQEKPLNDGTKPVEAFPEITTTIEPTSEALFNLKATATFNPKLSNLLVIYVKDGNLWRWDASGNNQLTVSGDVQQPQLSPDGKLVAFLRPVGDFHTEMWMIDVTGENERVLVSVDDLNTIGGGFRDPNAVAIAPYEFEWVPNTHLVAFNTQQILQGPGLFLLDDFHLVDADRIELKLVLLSGWGGVFRISPNGEKVALSTPTQISLANLDGSDFRQVLQYPQIITYSDYRYYARPVWKPDSSGLWVAIPSVDPLVEPVEPTSLYEIVPDDGNAKLVNQIMTVSFIETPVSYSPDAEYLIYLRESGNPQDHLRELYISKPDGSGAWMYQRDYLLKYVGWSIDSRRFLYTVGENQSAWLGDVNAAAVSILPEYNPIDQIKWIDRDNFLFTRVNYDAADLFLGNVQSPPRLLETRIDPPMIFDYFLGIP